MHSKEQSIKRIAITGPESTGKSELARKLAEAYGTCWVPEYAREYFEKLDRPYRESDILNIAIGQLASEQEYMQDAKRFLFCDTEAIVTRIWSMVKYGRCHPRIEEMIDRHPYDLYLLCDIDLPWEHDPLREHPDKREYLFDLYHRELKNRSLPFCIISGTGKTRLENAMKAIEDAF